MIRVAVDAMGGDHSPGVVVEGVSLLPPGEDVGILLVGDPDAIAACAPSDFPAEIIPATEVVEMCESPSVALKKKPNSSIAVCMRLVKEGRADAMVSMGNTGAVMAFALYLLQRIPGISRPAIAALIPSAKRPVLLLDVGANVDCKPNHLLQFGVMGSIYVEGVLGRENPRVGLLSIGSEAAKGNEVTLAARALFEAAPLNFGGHAEGNDVFSGEFDVVVCDGFVGNVVLKSGEGLAENIFGSFRHEIEKIESDSKDELRKVLHRAMMALDYSEYGGAPLLGMQGTCLVGHGRSSAKAICNAIRAARNASLHHVSDKIARTLEDIKR